MGDRRYSVFALGFGGPALALFGIRILFVVLRVGARNSTHSVNEDHREDRRALAPVEEAPLAPLATGSGGGSGRYEPVIADKFHTPASRTVLEDDPGLGAMRMRVEIDARGSVIDYKCLTPCSAGVIAKMDRMMFDGPPGKFELEWTERP